MDNLSEALTHDPQEMVLRTTTTSPFGRKVRIALEVLGLTDRVRIVPVRIPTHSATHSDHIRPSVPKYSATCE